MLILTAMARTVFVCAGSRLAGSLLNSRRKCPPATGAWAAVGCAAMAPSMTQAAASAIFRKARLHMVHLGYGHGGAQTLSLSSP